MNVLAEVRNAKTGLWGYVGSDGSYAIPPEFSDAGNFSGNVLASARDVGTGR